MKTAVIGSRSLNVNISEYIPDGVTEIVSGGADGIDLQAEAYADKHNIYKRIIKPECAKYGKAAPLRRNEIIVDMSDLIIAIWDGESRGTEYAINYAKRTGKPIEVNIILRNEKDTLNI